MRDLGTRAPRERAIGEELRDLRYNELDAVRAFAMLVVIGYHSAVNVLPGDAGQVTTSATRWIVSTAHTFQIPVFFVISGFLGALVVARAGRAEFARGRLRRIGLPLLAGWVLTAPLLNAEFHWAAEVRGDDRGPLTWDMLIDDRVHHLWFVWYLLLYCAIVLGVVTVARRLPAARAAVARAFSALIASPARLPMLVVPTAAALWFTDRWGIVVPTVVKPDPGPFAYYLAFFCFGWLLFGARGLLPELRRRPGVHAGVALVASIAVVVIVDNRPAGGTALDLAKLASVTLAAVTTWTVIVSLLGWFHRWLARPDPRVRYVADASYFLYLAHLPLVVGIYYGLMDAGVPVAIRVVVAPVVTVAVLLLIYDRFVRHTAVGRVLHGPTRAA